MPDFSMRAFAARLRRDKQGVALVEMALSVPLLMLLCLGMIDVSRLVATKIDLEQASRQTVDFILAKRPTNGTTTKYVAEAASAAGVPQSQVQVVFWLECDGVKAGSFTGECIDGEEVARFASITISKNVTTDFNWGKFAAMFDGNQRATTVTVVGDAVVRFQ